MYDSKIYISFKLTNSYGNEVKEVMGMRRWDPFSEMKRLQERFNRLLEEFEPFVPGREMPPVDIIEEEDFIRVLADIPGVEKSDIEVFMEGDSLVLRVEKSMETKEEKRNYLRREREYTSIYRKIHIPEEIDEDKVKATYRNGVLEVVLPKIRKKRKAIQVE